MSEPGPLARPKLPQSFSVPCARSQFQGAAKLPGLDGNGVIQTRVLKRWSDRSIAWCWVERSYTTEANEATVFVDSCGQQSIVIGQDGRTLFTLQLLLISGGREFVARAKGPVESLDSESCRHRKCVNLRFDEQPAHIEVSLVFDLLIGTPISQIEIVVRNSSPMDHPGGNWDLGASGSLQFDELRLSFIPQRTENDSHFSLELRDQKQIHEAVRSIDLTQASSGGENWNGSNHIDQFGNVPLEFQGYRASVDEQLVEGARADPVLHADYGARVSFAFGKFWQNFPCSLTATASEVCLSYFKHQELQGGEQKTFEFAVELSGERGESRLSEYIDAHRRPPIAADQVIAAQVWPYLTPRTNQSDARYESLVDLAIDSEDSFFAKRERIDQYGWRNYGDIWGDHEAAYHHSSTPMISHYNNQYDCTLGFAIQYLRTGDERWWELMSSMADHAWDIDTYHTDQDKLLYNGGLFWHTYHYADAHTSTHRSYPKQLRVSQSFEGGQDLTELGDTGEKLAKTYAVGGGPAASHNYNTGWMLAYYLTGKERYKTAAINAADYVLRIDDGNKTPFKWLSRADTGHSTCSSPGYYGPGRAAANSTHALLTGHELTEDAKYLDRAALLMRRTVHPKQDLDNLDLLNAELRWFYTMYLQALGRFVDYKDSLGQRDQDFRYGVATLLHYADWMERNERPTLSEPDKLQYPNETWAAQDMRKWHVLQHATLYQCDLERRRDYQVKADFFFDYVCDTLTASPTKSLCRPVVLMLNFGWQRDWFKANPNELRLTSPVDDDFGRHEDFVPQRSIAVKRFKLLIASAGTGFSVAAMALILWMLGRWAS